MSAQGESHGAEVVDGEGAEHGVEAGGVVGEAEADGAAGGRGEVVPAGGGYGDSMDPIMEEMACVGEGLVVQTCGPYRHNAVP